MVKDENNQWSLESVAVRKWCNGYFQGLMCFEEVREAIIGDVGGEDTIPVLEEWNEEGQYNYMKMSGRL